MTGSGSDVDRQRSATAARLLPVLGDNPALDRLTALTARLVGAASAQVSLLTTEQVVAGGYGLPLGAVGSSGPLNESLCTITAALGAPLVVPDAKLDERVVALPPVTSGVVGSYLGVPLRTSVGTIVGALCVFDPDPHTWSDHDQGVVEVLAESVMAELELSALSAEFDFGRLRWDMAANAADLGSFDVDLRTGQMVLDERMRVMYGLGIDSAVVERATVLERLHPEDRPVVDAAFAELVASGGDYRVEYRVVLPEGGVRWLTIRGGVRRDHEGRPVQLIGVAYDITEGRTARDRAAELLAAMTTGFLAVDGEWKITSLNRAGERILSMPAEDVRDRGLWDVFPGMEDLEFGRQFHSAVDTGLPVEFEAFYPPMGAWFEVRAVPAAEGLALYFLDITGRHRAQEAAEAARLRAEELRARSEAAASRLALLAAVSADLADSFEAEKAVARLAQLVVPVLADWSIVTLVEDNGTMRDVGWWHVDPAMRPVVERLAATRFEDRKAPGPVQAARVSSAPVVVRSDVMQRAAELLSADAMAAMRELAPESSLAVPLTARGRVVGVLSLCRGPSRAPMSDEAISTARQVAERAAMALDNARLYNEQRTLAESLQRSLLTAPPQPDDLHIVVRYVPASSGAAVGGDWYDSFLQDDGATVLVIGDVVGHNTEAAGAMGQLRGLLRGIAWSSGASPAGILGSLDAAIAGLGLGTVATAVVARLEQTDDQRREGTRTLRWSNAGHPPPLVLLPDTTVTALQMDRPELLLGVDPRTDRSDGAVTVRQGTTIVFYTDGLIERRNQNLETGVAQLGRILTELAGLPLEEVCDQILTRMLPEHPDDDVAVVAIHLH